MKTNTKRLDPALGYLAYQMLGIAMLFFVIAMRTANAAPQSLPGDAPSALAASETVRTTEETTEAEQPHQGAPGASQGTVRHVTAYNSVPEQTDETPCLAADGSDICKRYAAGEILCAANFVPFGTVLTISSPEMAAPITCTVADRMASRYSQRVDVYMGMDTERAKRFGTQLLFVR